MPRGKGPRKSRGSHDDSGDEEPIEFEDEEPKMDTSFKQCVVVDGLPVVPPEKHDKLLNVLRKFFNQDGIGKVVDHDAHRRGVHHHARDHQRENVAIGLWSLQQPRTQD